MTKRNEIHWEPDVRKGLDDIRKLPDIKRELKEDADRRKIDGYNPSDLWRK
ncbi:MAG: hypothetical protein GY854_07845 [Deltaproteobacteria bacterium]|nr:hypothetical protein [Deltaproteobacteria bacterium]